jgi:DNA polymerase III delta prime subunit
MTTIEILSRIREPRALWHELRNRAIDLYDDRRVKFRRWRKKQASLRMERTLKRRLHRELDRYQRIIVNRLTRLGFSTVRMKEHRRHVTHEIQIAQRAATPTKCQFRLDTVRMPWGSKNNVLELQEPYVLESLAASTMKPVTVDYSPDRGFWFDVQRAPKPKTTEFIDVLLGMPKTTLHTTSIPLGQDSNFKTLHAKIARMPHLLIAGTTGYGKSVFLHFLICSLIQREKPRDLRLTLVDLAGGVEFGAYRDLPHLYAQGGVEPRIYIEPEGVPDLLTKIRAEVKRRQEMFIEDGVRNIDGWNARHRIRHLPYWLVIIDEVQNVMLDSELGKPTENMLARIAAIARKFGIHLVIATQRPSTDVVTGLIKANFPARVAFNMASHHDSMTVLGNGDAASLGQPGLLIYSHATHYWTAQAPFISEALVRDIVERAASGEPALTELTHSVGKLEMVEWAIGKNAGEFVVDDVYFAFRGRGVTHADVRDCSMAFVGQMVEVGGKYYRMNRDSVFEEIK